MNCSYAKRILFALRMGEMTAYRISKEVSEGEGRVSSGTIYPALQRLSDDGLVTSGLHGRRILFRLTEKGKEYVEELVSMRKSIASKFFSNSVNDVMLGADFISDLYELKIMRSVVEDLSPVVISVIKRAYILRKENRNLEYSEIRDALMEVMNTVRAG